MTDIITYYIIIMPNELLYTDLGTSKYVESTQESNENYNHK